LDGPGTETGRQNVASYFLAIDFFLAGVALGARADDFAVVVFVARVEDDRPTMSDCPGKISGRRSPFERISAADDV